MTELNSEVVVHGQRRNRPNLFHRIASFLRGRDAVRPAFDSDDDTFAAQKLLFGRAFTRREQAAYERNLSAERETQRAVLHSSREGLDRTYRDLETAVGIFLDSSLREASRLGRAFYETRNRAPVTKLSAVQQG